MEGGQKTTATGTPVPTPLAAQTIETTKGDIGIPTHVRREIGRSGLHQVYPGVLFWECPDCGGQWHRFTIASREHHWAKKYMTTGGSHVQLP